MWIDNGPAAFSQSFALGIVRTHVHREFECRFRHASWQIDILCEGVLLREVRKRSVHFHRPTPIPLTDRGELRRARTRLRSEEHTSELQSRVDLVCRLLLEKKKTHTEAPPAKYAGYDH